MHSRYSIVACHLCKYSVRNVLSTVAYVWIATPSLLRARLTEDDDGLKRKDDEEGPSHIRYTQNTVRSKIP